MNKDYYIGIDIGGTKCAVLAGTEEMEILERIAFPTETHKGPNHAIGLLLHHAKDIANKYGRDHLRAVGISCGGPLDSKRGLVLSPPNLPGWDEIPIVQQLAEALGVPAYLQNDANACALAEWKFGAGKGTDNMVFLTFGTGMGAGLIIDGRIYSGTNDLAGEVGHIRLEEDGPVGFGKKGSFEGFCSGGGIAQLAQKAAAEKIEAGQTVSFCAHKEDIGKITAKDVAQAADAGNADAIEIFKTSGRYLGMGLSILIDVLNPQAIVIGSIYERAGHLLEPAARQVIEQEAIASASNVCRILPAALGDAIGDYASLSVAMTGG
jgi:glucokinase